MYFFREYSFQIDEKRFMNMLKRREVHIISVSLFYVDVMFTKALDEDNVRLLSLGEDRMLVSLIFCSL